MQAELCTSSLRIHLVSQPHVLYLSPAVSQGSMTGGKNMLCFEDTTREKEEISKLNVRVHKFTHFTL